MSQSFRFWWAHHQNAAVSQSSIQIRIAILTIFNTIKVKLISRSCRYSAAEWNHPSSFQVCGGSSMHHFLPAELQGWHCWSFRIQFWSVSTSPRRRICGILATITGKTGKLFGKVSTSSYPISFCTMWTLDRTAATAVMLSRAAT